MNKKGSVMNKRIYRWETPGQYDTLPYGTEIVRLQSSYYPTAVIFKQTSLDQESPKWESVSEVIGSTASLDSPVL